MSTPFRWHSSCPTRTEMMWFARFVEDDDPSKPKRLVRFQQEVLWVMESESTARLFLHDRKVDEYSTFSDFYGYGSSTSLVGDAHEGAGRMAAHFGLSESTPYAEVAVFTTLQETPAKVIEAREGRKTEYEKLNGDWWLASDEDWEKLQAFDWSWRTYEPGEWQPVRLDRIQHPPIKVWSSLSPVTAEEAKAIFLSAHPDPRVGHPMPEHLS